MKFVKKEGMIHVQIQQAEALPEGAVDLVTLEWVKLEDIRFDEKASHREKDLVFKMFNAEGEESTLKMIEDYGYFDENSHRVYVDDLIVPTNYVVTGTATIFFLKNYL